jgi:hypothetical protein
MGDMAIFRRPKSATGRAAEPPVARLRVGDRVEVKVGTHGQSAGSTGELTSVDDHGDSCEARWTKETGRSGSPRRI